MEWIYMMFLDWTFQVIVNQIFFAGCTFGVMGGVPEGLQGFKP